MIKNILIFCILIFLIGSSHSLWAQKPLMKDNLYVKGILKNESKIVSSPGGGTVARLKEFNIVYIFEEPRDGYYKVGTDASKAKGFLPEEDLQVWNSRICLHFTPQTGGRKPALIFKDAEPLKACLSGAEDFYSPDGTPHDKSIAQEPDDELAEKRFAMLLPVLDRERTKSGASNSPLYKVGFLAGGKTKFTPEASGSRRPSSKLAELELMFLLDATYSMNPYIEATKDVIENVTQRILKSREGGVRFGVAAYRDYIDNQTEMEYITKQFSDLTSNSRTVIKNLANVYQANVDSEDAAEAVFDGYFAAVTETSWRDAPNTLRVIVLIGDASGHKPGSPKNPMNYSEDLLLSKASENRVRTIAVKILSGRTADDDLSRSQFDALAEGSTSADKGQYIEVEYPNDAHAVPEEFVTKTSAKIEAEINRLEKLIDVVEDSRSSGSDAPVFSSDISSTDRAIILKNIKIESIDAGSKPIVFSTGWIGESNNDGQKNVTPFVYITKNEFERMLTYVRLVDQVIVNPELALDGTISEVIEMTTGDPLEGNDIEKHYTKTTGLPIKTDILKIPVTELNTWGEERKNRMLKLVQGKLLTLENWNNALDNWFNAPGKSKMKYTFIPVDMLP